MPDSEQALPYRVRRLEEDQEAMLREQQRHTEALAVHTEQISGAGGLVKAMERLGKKVDSLNKALYAFAGSFIIAAVTIAVAIGGGH